MVQAVEMNVSFTLRRQTASSQCFRVTVRWVWFLRFVNSKAWKYSRSAGCLPPCSWNGHTARYAICAYYNNRNQI